MKFEDVTKKRDSRKVGWGQGVCVGDYNNDGFRDLFVTHYGQSVLYRNRGDGTFEDATERGRACVRTSTRWDTGCTFFDYDRDGRLDLAVTNYLEFDRAKVPEAGSGTFCLWKGMPVMCGPRGLPFARNYLFHNDGGGRFADVSLPSGIGKTKGCYGFTVVASDFDNDDYPDLYVACDSTPSLLYHNEKNGTFREVGLLSGVALNEDGQEQGGMGIAAATTTRTATAISSRPISATISRTCTTTSAAARSKIASCRRVWAPTWSMWAGARISSTWITTGGRISFS